MNLLASHGTGGQSIFAFTLPVAASSSFDQVPQPPKLQTLHRDKAPTLIDGLLSTSVAHIAAGNEIPRHPHLVICAPAAILGATQDKRVQRP